MEANPLVVIVGPTASGKTSLAIDLAKRYGGEIICADSRTIYKEMDIGTAKPTAAQRSEVPHWGLDLVEPGESFSAYNFKIYANQKIQEIRKRGNIPFMVGGTGLYIDAVLFDYEFGQPADPELRQTLQLMSVSELQNYCIKYNIKLPENEKNKRYLIRSIEQKKSNSKRRNTPIENTIIVGIATEKSTLRDRIHDRIEQLFKDSVVNEAILLGKKYGWDNEAMTGNIYPLVRSYLSGDAPLEEIKRKAEILDWHLAKRQMTWLRRNQYIRWLPLCDAEVSLSDALANR